MSDTIKPESRELFNEISAIMNGIMSGFSLSKEQVIELLEKNKITLLPGKDENDEKYILASFSGKELKLYPKVE